MAYIDMYDKINAGLKKYGTPQKKYADESQRRQWYENYLNLKQGYESARYQTNSETSNLRDSVTNEGYARNNVRGSYVGDAFNKGMVGVQWNDWQRMNNLASGLRGQQNAEWAYANRPRGGGVRARPAAPPVPGAAGESVGRAIMDRRLYDRDTPEGQGTGLYPQTTPVSRGRLIMDRRLNRNTY